MEGRGRSRRHSPHRQWKRRLSSVLAIVLTAVMVLNMPLSIDGLGLHVSNAFASGSNAGREGTIWATASNAKHKQGVSQDVDIYVIADDDGAVPGNTSSMTLYLKNNTNQMITEGVLTFKGSHIQKEDGIFQDIGAGDEASQVIVSGPGQDAGTTPESGAAADDGAAANGGAPQAADVSGNDAAQGTGLDQDTVTSGEGLLYEESFDADEAGEDSDFAEDFEGDEEDSEEEETWKLTGIDLQPGEMHEVSFAFYTDEDVKSTKAHVKFSFAGEDEEGERVSSDTQFYYSIGLPHVNISLEDGMQIESNVNNDMEIWMTEPDWVDEALESRIEAIEEKEAEREYEALENEAEQEESGKSLASPSDAQTASPSDAPSHEDTAVKEDQEKIEQYANEAMKISESKVSYEVEIYGAKFDRFSPRKAEEVEDLGWISCVYQVASHTEPGLYYGKVKANGRWNNKQFTSEQGFFFEVTGEGRNGQEFTADLDRMTVYAYAEEGVLPEGVQLQATELVENDAVTGEKFQEAKAALDAEGTQYDGMTALDITFVDEDGNEVEPDGEVQVSIQMKEGVLPEEVNLETVKVHHLKETAAQTVEVEAVADGADETEGTVQTPEEAAAQLEASQVPEEEIEAAVSQEAEAVAMFRVDSFSTFTITWSNWRETENYFTVTVTTGYLNDQGIWTELNAESRLDGIAITDSSGGRITLRDRAPEIDGYTYQEARLGSSGGDTVTELEFTRNGNWPRYDYYLTFYNERGFVAQYTHDNGNDNAYSLYMVYEPNEVTGDLTIQNNIIEDGELKAVPGTAIADQVSSYRWYRSEDGIDFGEPIELQRFENGTTNLSGDKSENINIALDSWTNRNSQDERFYYKVEALNEAGEVIAESAVFQVPYYMQLENGSFEEPGNPSRDPGSDRTITGSQWANQWSNDVYAANGGVWQTTGVMDGQDIEIVNVNYDEGKYQWNPWLPFEAADGIQFAELNCERDGALYQDVLTLEGQELNYWLSHRARGQLENSTPEYDTMYVVIMPTSLALTGGDGGGPIDTQEEVLEYINRDVDGVYYQEYTSDDQGWHSYQSIGDYIAASYLTRFFFVAVDTAAEANQQGEYTQGNFLDEVGFSTELPPIDPGEGYLVVKKVVKGLTEEEAESYQVNIQVTGDQTLNAALDKFTNTYEGYTDSYIWTVPVGSYSVSETIPEEVADALAELNNGPDVQISVNGEVVSDGSADVQITDGGTCTVVFTNTYEKNTVDLRVEKRIEGNMSDPDDTFTFLLSLHDKNGDSYTREINAVTAEGIEAAYSYDSNADGYVFQLKGGQHIEFEAPYGYQWTVEETDPGHNYSQVVYQINDAAEVENDYSAEGESLSGNANVIFTNIANMNTPTGFSSNHLPYITMMAIAVLGGAGVIYPVCRQRRKRS